MHEEVDGYTVPLHRALTEPMLLAGAPRALAILNGTVTAAFVLGLHWLYALPLGALVHLGAVVCAKRDPQGFEVLLGHLRRHSFYHV